MYWTVKHSFPIISSLSNQQLNTSNKTLGICLYAHYLCHRPLIAISFCLQQNNITILEISLVFVSFVRRLKQSQKFLSPSNPEFIGYMLYMSSSFSTVFISLHKMTRWWQNYYGLHGENIAWAYWLFALHISQQIYCQRPRVYNCFCLCQKSPQ